MVGNDERQSDNAVVVVVLVRRVGVAGAIAVAIVMSVVAGLTVVVMAGLFASQAEADHIPVVMVGDGGVQKRQQKCERDEPTGYLGAKLHK